MDLSSQYRTAGTFLLWDKKSQSLSQQPPLPTTTSQLQLQPQNQDYPQLQHKLSVRPTTSRQQNLGEVHFSLAHSALTKPAPVRRVFHFSSQQSGERMLPSPSPCMQRALYYNCQNAIVPGGRRESRPTTVIRCEPKLRKLGQRVCKWPRGRSRVENGTSWHRCTRGA